MGDNRSVLISILKNQGVGGRIGLSGSANGPMVGFVNTEIITPRCAEHKNVLSSITVVCTNLINKINKNFS